MTKKTNILDRAKNIGEAAQKEKEAQVEAKAAGHRALSKKADDMKDLVVKELKKINNKENKYGKFKLELIENPGWDKVFAYLTVTNKNKGFMDYKVAWFKSGVISGTYDASDDCRDIPYTEACIWTRFYSPYPNRENHDGMWDVQENRWSHNGGWTFYASSTDKMEKFFEEMTSWLATWFQ